VKPVSGAYPVIKRALDVCASLVLLLLFSPILLVVGVLVRLRIGSPVLFSQVRPGMHGRPFRMFKFRGMTDERGENGELLPDAARLTPFGRFLRSSSLDELPELWNVLRGDMSLVGPRPLLMEYLPLYSAQQARRHDVRPGMTGWAQVNGRNAMSWESKFEHDVWYVERMSLWLDLRIIGRTILVVFQRRGITSAGSATAEKFSGNKQ